MRRAFKYRLDPTKAQAAALAEQVETLRRVYNAALDERKHVWDVWKQGTNWAEQVKRWLIRRNLVASGDGPGYVARVAAVAVRDTIKRLNKAYENFFRRLAEWKLLPAHRKALPGSRPGPGQIARPEPPGFRGRQKYHSIPFDNNSGCKLRGPKGQRIDGNMPDDAGHTGYRLDMFGVGRVRVRLHRPVKGKIKTACVKREGEFWYVVFSCDLGDVPVAPHPGPAVGIDVGLEHFLTTSEGEHVPNPQFLGAALPELRRTQRAASRKYVRGRRAVDQSGRWRKEQRRVTKLHARVKNQRREHHYRTANDLVRKFGTVAAESLNVQGMVRNRRLARHIQDAGWAGFLGVLRHAASKAGARVIEVDPRGTSQECPCGADVRKDLKVRRHRCPACGLDCHRDHASARVILARALGQEPPRTGEAGANSGVAPGGPESSTHVRRLLLRATKPLSPVQLLLPFDSVKRAAAEVDGLG